jgi:hypothetical protein
VWCGVSAPPEVVLVLFGSRVVFLFSRVFCFKRILFHVVFCFGGIIVVLFPTTDLLHIGRGVMFLIHASLATIVPLVVVVFALCNGA